MMMQMIYQDHPSGITLVYEEQNLQPCRDKRSKDVREEEQGRNQALTRQDMNCVIPPLLVYFLIDHLFVQFVHAKKNLGSDWTK